MFTVALIGPDGSGKTTISRGIQAACPLPLKYLYMGVNTTSSNRMLPTTRLAASIKKLAGEGQGWEGPPDPNRPKAKPKGLANQLKSGVRAWLRLGNRLFEESYRQVLTWVYELRGNLVLYDRHFFFDYYSYDIAPTQSGTPITRRLHGLWLKYILPKPDLVIFLDAPAEVLFARKGEGTVETLERMRQEYLGIGRQLKNFHVINATQPVDEVVAQAIEIISRHATSRGFKPRAEHPQKEVQNV